MIWGASSNAVLSGGGRLRSVAGVDEKSARGLYHSDCDRREPAFDTNVEKVGATDKNAHRALGGLSKEESQSVTAWLLAKHAEFGLCKYGDVMEM